MTWKEVVHRFMFSYSEEFPLLLPKLMICSSTCSLNRKLPWEFFMILMIIFKHSMGSPIAILLSFQIPDSARLSLQVLGLNCLFHSLDMSPKTVWITAFLIFICFYMYRRVQMTRSGCTVLLAWSKAFTNACFSAALICMIFLLTGTKLMEEEEDGGAGGERVKGCSVVRGTEGERRKEKCY